MAPAPTSRMRQPAGTRPASIGRMRLKPNLAWLTAVAGRPVKSGQIAPPKRSTSSSDSAIATVALNVLLPGDDMHLLHVLARPAVIAGAQRRNRAHDPAQAHEINEVAPDLRQHQVARAALLGDRH